MSTSIQSFYAKKLETQNNQTENRPRRNYQRTKKQLHLLTLPLNKMYQKLLSIGQVALVSLTPLKPPYSNWYK